MTAHVSNSESGMASQMPVVWRRIGEDQPLRRDMTGLQDAQRREQLAAEEGLAPPLA